MGFSASYSQLTYEELGHTPNCTTTPLTSIYSPPGALPGAQFKTAQAESYICNGHGNTTHGTAPHSPLHTSPHKYALDSFSGRPNHPARPK